MTTLLQKPRRINELLQQKNTVMNTSSMPYNRMAMILGDILDTITYIISSDGKLLGINEKYDINNDRVKNILVERQFPVSYTDLVDRLEKTKENIPITDDLTASPIEFREMYPDGLTTIVAIYRAGERLGTIILSILSDSFIVYDLVLAEYSATLL